MTGVLWLGMSSRSGIIGVGVFQRTFKRVINWTCTLSDFLLEVVTMTESPPDSWEGSRGLRDGIDISQNAETILKTLQAIASREGVSSVAIRCLELSQHDDEEIRSWATECLSSSVRPGKDEELSLLDALEAKLNTTSHDDSERGGSENDLLYWLVTLAGRLELDAPSAKERAKSLLARVVSLGHAPAVERAQRISQRIS